VGESAPPDAAAVRVAVNESRSRVISSFVRESVVPVFQVRLVSGLQPVSADDGRRTAQRDEGTRDMKIVVLVESLTFGGAERQACVLAGEFKRRGHDVCVVTYHQDDFYRPLLELEQVEHRFLGGNGKLAWALNVRRFLRTYGQDVVLAFLPGPSAYAELAGLPKRSWGLVVSERSAGYVNRSWLKMYLHTVADCVIANSHSARLVIQNRFPRLRSKLVTIYNAVQIRAPGQDQQASVEPHEFRLVVPASLDRNKNAQGLLLALQILRASQPFLQVRVDWYGSQKVEPELLPEIRRGVADLGLEQVFHLHPATDHIHDVMSEADAVALASFYEGLPNAVCEGMMLGKPILMSDVCDARNLVEEGVNGFLFDPCDPNSIASAIRRFAEPSREERVRMGRASRCRAEALFNTDMVADRYLRILKAAAARKPLKIEHWPDEMPDTVLKESGREKHRTPDDLPAGLCGRS
jgi:glycosyltransferase involved in cell wall biosynthesis